LVLCAQNRELLEEARAAKCYRDELDIVKEKVSEFIVILWSDLFWYVIVTTICTGWSKKPDLFEHW